MTPDRINSTGQIVLKSESLENNTRSGNGYTRVFTGSLATIEAQRLVELGGGATMVKIESESDGNYQLTSYYPWDVTHGSNAEAPVNIHELEITMESVDIFSSDVLLNQLIAAFGGFAAGTFAKGFLKSAVDRWNDSGPYQTYTAFTNAVTAAEAAFSSASTPPGPYSGSQLTLMIQLFRGIAYHGVTSAIQFPQVYSRRITAATPNQVVASGVGVGQIWTSAEVTAFEGIPPVNFFQLSDALLWFKCGPRVKFAASQKTEVAYEYKSLVYAWAGTNTAYGLATLLTY